MLTDSDVKKTEADRLEKEITSEFFMINNAPQKKKDIGN
jgi:hypothetical protein